MDMVLAGPTKGDHARHAAIQKGLSYSELMDKLYGAIVVNRCLFDLKL